MTVKSTVTTLAIALLAALVTPRMALGADSCAVGPRPAGVPEGSIEFAEYPIIDLVTSKPGKPMHWGSVLAPAGWLSSPGMRWSQRASCARNAQDDRWTIQAPDGSVQVSLLPAETWKIRRRFSGSSTASSCAVRTYEDAEFFLRDLVERVASSSRDLKPRSRPDILASRTPAEAQRAQYELFETGISAAELNFTFTSGDGPRDAVLISIVALTESAPGIPERDLHGSSAISLLASFPLSKVDTRLIEAIRRSGFRNSVATPERPHDVRPLGMEKSFGGVTFTATSAADLWRDASGRYFLFPDGDIRRHAWCSYSSSQL